MGNEKFIFLLHLSANFHPYEAKLHYTTFFKFHEYIHTYIHTYIPQLVKENMEIIKALK